VKAVDFDGDAVALAAGSFNVAIVDDVPVIAAPDSKTVIESTANTQFSNAFATSSATGSLAIG
jgi:hypothetical protein